MDARGLDRRRGKCKAQRLPRHQQQHGEELDHRDGERDPQHLARGPLMRPQAQRALDQAQIEIGRQFQRGERKEGDGNGPCQRDIAVAVGLRGDDRHDLARAFGLGRRDGLCNALAVFTCQHVTSSPKSRRRRSCRRLPKSLRRRRPSQIHRPNSSRHCPSHRMGRSSRRANHSGVRRPASRG